MHVLAIVLGILLLLFGGGCTLIGLVMVIDEPSAFFSDIALLLSVWLPIGLAPLFGGFFLIRYGLRREREFRKTPPPPQQE